MTQPPHPTTRLRFLIPALAAVMALCVSSCGSPRASSGKGTLAHIGFVWLKKPGDTAGRQKIIDAVHTFEREIPEVSCAIVGETDGIGGPFSDTSYDVGFVLSFKDEASRLRYNSHPVHEKAAKEVFLPLSRRLLFYRFVTK